MFFLLTTSVGHVYADNSKSFMEIARNVDWSCMRLQTGVCPKPEPPYAGVRWKYWEPVLVMESVKAPGDYVIREIGPVVGPFAKQAARISLGTATGLKGVDPGGGNGSQALGGSHLQFNEVHLYDFPLKMFMDAALCPSIPNMTLGIRYLSEADSSQWRMQNGEKVLFQVGQWGPLYPRTGFLVHTDPGVASALHVLRAVSIAGDIVSKHTVESPLDFRMNLLTDKMQMIYPSKGACMVPGTDARLWQRQAVSGEGEYVWIFWRRRECCR
jgi:hypothetical protein